jgi:hypothetical protein
VAETSTDFLAILQRLREHEIDFIVVGGVCAILQGAPITTFDLDLVHSRESQNVDRLLAALDTLDAHYREPASRGIKPNRSHLSSPGHQLLMTCFGPLDLLGAIGSGHDYPNLLSQSVEMEISSKLKVRVLGLSALIKSKEETAGEKDRAVLPTLRRTLEEKSKT